MSLFFISYCKFERKNKKEKEQLASLNIQPVVSTDTVSQISHHQGNIPGQLYEENLKPWQQFQRVSYFVVPKKAKLKTYSKHLSSPWIPCLLNRQLGANISFAKSSPGSCDPCSGRQSHTARGKSALSLWNYSTSFTVWKAQPPKGLRGCAEGHTR